MDTVINQESQQKGQGIPVTQLVWLGEEPTTVYGRKRRQVLEQYLITVGNHYVYGKKKRVGNPDVIVAYVVNNYTEQELREEIIETFKAQGIPEPVASTLPVIEIVTDTPNFDVPESQNKAIKAYWSLMNKPIESSLRGMGQPSIRITD